MRRIKSLAIALLVCLATAGQIEARARDDAGSGGAAALAKVSIARLPNAQNCVHKYNNLILHISNWGFFGGLDGTYQDCEAGELYLSGEFPVGSGIEYVYQGALWLGAVVGEDTLVSVGADGWIGGINEMWPCSDASCAIERRSNRPSDPYFHDSARSDLEYIAVYSDTLADRRWVDQDPTDRRSHIPLGVEIVQTSYSWSVEYAQDFILLDFAIRNIGQDEIENLYLGIYSDGDVGHVSRGGQQGDRHLDDICGFLPIWPASVGHGLYHTLNMTYICDNDGDPSDGYYDYLSATGVLGTMVMRAPGENKVCFNWWQSNGDSRYDWGPMREATRRPDALGTPSGDRNKYYVLSNSEQDYGQLFAAEDYSDIGWLPPATAVSNSVARGGDTRFLLSFGPFDIRTGDTLNLTCAYVAGEALHKDPTAFERFMEVSPPDPNGFLGRLDFSDAAANAIWASWVYDNPGVDTDGNGTFGEFWEIADTLPDGSIVIDTFWYAGDGVPDFRAATAPPPPVVRFTTRTGEVTLRWNGLISETAIDPFTKEADFEGYRVYMGRVRTLSSMALVESRDLLDYKRFYWDRYVDRWICRWLPFTLAELKEIYGEDFDPEDNGCTEDGIGWTPGGDDTLTYCFEPVDWNQSIACWDDGTEVIERTGIRKTFCDSIAAGYITSDLDIADTLTSPNWYKDINPVTGDSAYYHKYYEYEYAIDNVLPSVPWYFSVTTFDFGDFTNSLESMESSPLANAVEVWAMNDASVVEREAVTPEVYPNPYIGDGRYWDAAYEDPSRTGFIDHERRIHFINLPHRCTIRIYTLSGDLVKVIEHPGPDSNTDARVQWNMRSRNNELVASGIYVYSVQSAGRNSVGKIVIIL